MTKYTPDRANYKIYLVAKKHALHPSQRKMNSEASIFSLVSVTRYTDSRLVKSVNGNTRMLYKKNR